MICTRIGASALVTGAPRARVAVAISGHYGNFELVGFTLGLFGFETYTVARPLDNRFLDQLILQFRTARGQHFLPKNGSAGDITRVSDVGRVELGAQQYDQKCWFNDRPSGALSIFQLPGRNSGSM